MADESNTIPYVCTNCGVTYVKLWRQWNTMADHTRLLCATCASNDQGENINDLDEKGLHTSSYDGRLTDKIGNLVAAVPTPDMTTFWGYTSIPQADLDWWYALPNFPPRDPNVCLSSDAIQRIGGFSEDDAPPSFRFLLVEDHEELVHERDMLVKRDAAAQRLIGLLRYHLGTHEAAGRDYPPYREWRSCGPLEELFDD